MKRGPARLGLVLAGALAAGSIWLQAAAMSEPGVAQAAFDSPAGAGAKTALTRASTAEMREVQVPASAEHPAYSVYVPGRPDAMHTTILALHGIGGNGPSLAGLLLPLAQSQGWTIVAPTIPYGDWTNPTQLSGEELRLLPQLAGLLDYVPAETGAVVSDRIMLFGFSRGAQAALRFSLLFPERVQAVAAISAGTYTLPERTVKTIGGPTVTAPFPYGVADLEQRSGRPMDPTALGEVKFLIEVGGNDKNEADVPRQWDPYLGTNRLERAQRFADSLVQLGLDAQFTMIPGASHEVNGAMMDRVSAFLLQSVCEETPDSPAPAPAPVPTPAAVPVAAATVPTSPPARGV